MTRHHRARRARVIRGALTTALVALAPVGSHAADIRVSVAGAAKAAIERIAPEFKRITGDQLVLSVGTVGVMRDRLLAGEPADLAILSAAAMAELAAQGLVTPGDQAELGVVIGGLAVQRGAPIPDIATPAALVTTLRKARSVAYANAARGATSGAHFERLLGTLGVAAELGAKTTVVTTGLEAVDGVANGHYEIGVSQSSEIIPVSGVVFVGGFPPPFELKTTYVAGIVKGSVPGRQLLEFLKTEPSRQSLRAAGLAPP